MPQTWLRSFNSRVTQRRARPIKTNKSKTLNLIKTRWSRNMLDMYLVMTPYLSLNGNRLTVLRILDILRYMEFLVMGHGPAQRLGCSIWFHHDPLPQSSSRVTSFNTRQPDRSLVACSRREPVAQERLLPQWCLEMWLWQLSRPQNRKLRITNRWFKRSKSTLTRPTTLSLVIIFSHRKPALSATSCRIRIRC